MSRLVLLIFKIRGKNYERLIKQKNHTYEVAKQRIKKATLQLGLPLDVYECLKAPDRVVEASIPVEMDNGEIKVFTGYRAQHNNTLGPYKGGIRFHQNVDSDEVKEHYPSG